MKMSTQSLELERLQNEWKEMYQHTLPKAATSKNPAQVKFFHVPECLIYVLIIPVSLNGPSMLIMYAQRLFQNLVLPFDFRKPSIWEIYVFRIK